MTNANLANKVETEAEKTLATEVELDFVAKQHGRLKEIFGDVDYSRDNRYPGMIEAIIAGKRTLSNIFADYESVGRRTAGVRW